MNDEKYMKQALRLAAKGAGYVEPNPMVGCVIVRNGQVVGTGWHHRFGKAHAEVEALRDAGAKARRSTVYVTLEPCAHLGKTPACTGALIDAGVGRVVIGCSDPNPTSANGVKRFVAAGIDVTIGVCEDESKRLIEPFVKTISTGLPYVISKWAATADGAIATHTGDSKWISNERSRRIVHQLRARVDAIFVGINTVIADDPQLTARNVKVRRAARRVVIDPKLRLPMDCRLLKTLDEAPITVAVGANAPKRKRARLENMGVEVKNISSLRNGKLNLRSLLKHLTKKHAATNVLVEGGATTHGAMFAQNLADEAMIFIGPILLGDGAGRMAVAGGPKIDLMRSAKRMDLIENRRIDDNVLLRYAVR